MAGAAIITDKQLYAASEALAASLTEEERAEGRVFPRVRRIREVALKVVRVLTCGYAFVSLSLFRRANRPIDGNRTTNRRWPWRRRPSTRSWRGT